MSQKTNKTSTSKSKKTNTMKPKQSIDSMKYEIASEFGVKLGPDATARANGSGGGEITKRLVKRGMSHLGGTTNTTKK